MYVRAIVGGKRADGSIIGVVCRTNGYDIIDALKRDFTSFIDVNFILDVGIFDTIYSKDTYEDFLEWAKTENIDISNKIFTPYGESIIVHDKRQINKEVIEYKNIKETLEQCVDVVYVFEDGQWEEYRPSTHSLDYDDDEE